MDTKFVPQYSLDDIYISPFSEKRVYNSETGKAEYIPLERNQNPTGVKVLDDFIRYISENSNFSRKVFCNRHGIVSSDLTALCRILTGMNAEELYYAIRLRLINDLLRYTNLTPTEVAKRSGANTHQNLCLIIRSEYGCSPRTRRLRIQSKGDAGRYRV